MTFQTFAFCLLPFAFCLPRGIVLPKGFGDAKGKEDSEKGTW
jgi:hypothetical protein